MLQLRRWSVGALALCCAVTGCEREPDCSRQPVVFCGETLGPDALGASCSQATVKDVRLLQCAPKLERVDLGGTTVRDIATLKGLGALRSVGLSRTKVTSLAPIAALPALERVDLRWVDVDLTPLAHSAHLVSVKIGGAHMRSLSVVEPLVQLKQLSIVEVPANDASPIAKLTKLESLELHVTKVADLSPLSRLPELDRISIRHSPVESLAPLEKSRRLRSIDLEKTLVSAEEIARFERAKPHIRVTQR